jgi:hypothetical protein
MNAAESLAAAAVRLRRAASILTAVLVARILPPLTRRLVALSATERLRLFTNESCQNAANTPLYSNVQSD